MNTRTYAFCEVCNDSELVVDESRRTSPNLRGMVACRFYIPPHTNSKDGTLLGDWAERVRNAGMSSQEETDGTMRSWRSDITLCFKCREAIREAVRVAIRRRKEPEPLQVPKDPPPVFEQPPAEFPEK